MPATSTHIAVALVNFNTADLTLRCVDSLVGEGGNLSCLVLDNGSREDDVASLQDGLALRQGARTRLICSEANLGFAGGCNRLFHEALSDPAVGAVVLLNNDAVALPGFIPALRSALEQGPEVGLAGARMHRLASPDVVDTLGITLFGSLMASDRHDIADPYLGPTGGCCILSRALLEDLLAANGECFAESFFCYWEDTDLVLRARLLGYQPVFVDECLALHQGQASSGGGYNDFIAYHGLRNAVWTVVRCMPWPILLTHGWRFLAANLMTIGRYVVTGRLAMVWRIYRDALRGIPACWRERRAIQASRKIPVRELRAWISPKFYRSGYIAGVLRGMVRRGGGDGERE